MSRGTPGPLFCSLNHQETSIQTELWYLQLWVYLHLCKAFLVVQENMKPLPLSFQMQLCWNSGHCHDLPKFLLKSYYCFSMILMSTADNAHEVLFLAVVFFILGCQSVWLIASFYPHRWLYQLKEATKPCVIDRTDPKSGLKSIMPKWAWSPEKNEFRTAARFIGLKSHKLVWKAILSVMFLQPSYVP